jgi:hypothetical protein
MLVAAFGAATFSATIVCRHFTLLQLVVGLQRAAAFDVSGFSQREQTAVSYQAVEGSAGVSAKDTPV